MPQARGKETGSDGRGECVNESVLGGQASVAPGAVVRVWVYIVTLKTVRNR